MGRQGDDVLFKKGVSRYAPAWPLLNFCTFELCLEFAVLFIRVKDMVL